MIIKFCSKCQPDLYGKTTLILHNNYAIELMKWVVFEAVIKHYITFTKDVHACKHFPLFYFHQNHATSLFQIVSMSFKVLTAKKMQRIFQFKYSNYINSSQPEISSCYFGYVAHLIKYTTIVCVVHLTCRFDLMYLYCAKINLNFTFHS